MKTIYKHIFPVKALFLLELICGSVILSYMIHLFNNDIYPNIWTFAGPMLGAALILTGLRGSKINEINIDASQGIIQISKVSISTTKIIKIKLTDLKSELIFGDGRNSFLMRNLLLKKLQLVIFDADQNVAEIKSNFLGLNNDTIRKLHGKIKEISNQ
ncbi:MAG: hypothetical protein GQ574_23445 [Crocinitomix sp.]|nr:hypothetical protein [Crocinitomix sp.]